MRIAFCFNVCRDGMSGVAAERDFDAPDTIEKISNVIKSLGHTVFDIEVRENIFEKLGKLKGEIDLVFNMAEGLHGDAREAWVPLACEVHKIPYTHSSPTVHALKLNKTLAKLAVKGLGVAVPEPGVFPAIIKPNAEGSSVGIFDANVVDDQKNLERRMAELRKMGFEGELIAEEYIDGREITVGMLGDKILPIIEQKFDILPKGMKPIAGFELKWQIEDKLDDLKKAYDCPAKLDWKLQKEVEKTVRLIVDGLGVLDCARIDFRIDRKGRLYFLELNTIPGLIPDENVISYLPLAARNAGISFKELIKTILESAAKRWKICG